MKTTLATIALISGLHFCSASAAETRDPKVYLRAPVDMPFASLAKILDALNAAGVKNLPTQTTSISEAKDTSIFLSVNQDTSIASITLTVDKDTCMASVINVLAACKAVGLKTVSVSTTTTGGTTK